MTEEEFSDFYLERIKEMPASAGDDAFNFIDANGIKFKRRVSDELVNLAEVRNQQKYPAAITTFDDTERKYWAVFRSAILDAPAEIARTIVWHETIHVWVHPVLYPARGFKAIPHVHLEKVGAYRKQMADQLGIVRKKEMPKSDYEESLVKFISASWGSDEKVALDWFVARIKPEEPKPSV